MHKDIMVSSTSVHDVWYSKRYTVQGLGSSIHAHLCLVPTATAYIDGRLAAVVAHCEAQPLEVRVKLPISPFGVLLKPCLKATLKLEQALSQLHDVDWCIGTLRSFQQLDSHLCSPACMHEA